jgi:hypothetical protein
MVDQAPLSKHYDYSKGVYAPENAPVRDTQIAVYACDSSPNTRVESPGGKTRAQSSYAGCHHHEEAQIDVDQTGVLFLNSSVRYSQIPDGATNTIFIGEKVDTKTTLGWVSGTRETLRNTSSILGPPSRHQPQHQQPPDPMPANHVGGFGSYHVGGAQFTLGDGSVRFLSENIDPQVFKNLGNRGDGAIVGDF